MRELFKVSNQKQCIASEASEQVGKWAESK